MIVYPSAINLSTQTLHQVTHLLTQHRARIGSRWRRLPPARQALLVLAHLRNGDTYQRLATGFRVGIATVHRYITEVVDLLSARAPSLRAALTRLCWTYNNFAILDGTVIRTDRVNNKTYYSGKHRHYGVNLQALTDPYGRLLWLSDGLPGVTHDIIAARHHNIADLCHQAELLLLADYGYTGLAPHTRTPYRDRKNLTPPYKAANKAHSSLRARGEHGFATLKNWHVLDRVRSCPRRAHHLAKAVLTLEHGPDN